MVSQWGINSGDDGFLFQATVGVLLVVFCVTEAIPNRGYSYSGSGSCARYRRAYQKLRDAISKLFFHSLPGSYMV